MGRMVKNYFLHTGSHAIGLPLGTPSIGPQYPRDGQVRFNVAANTLEVYYSNAWHGISQAGRVAIVKDQMVGDGVTLSFVMAHAPLAPEDYLAGQEADILVFVGNIYQNPGVSYTIGGNTINFLEAPNFGVPIVVLHNFNSTHVR